MSGTRWIPPKIWQGQECWIIGGGSSILKQFNVPEFVKTKIQSRECSLSILSEYLTALHDKNVIGINTAYKIGNWIGFVFFGDKGWYLVHREGLKSFPGYKVSCHGSFVNRSKDDPENIKYMERDSKRYGISDRPGFVSWNFNSGAAGINLAYHLGVSRIILLGFDMDIDENGYTHWHGSHKEIKDKRVLGRDPFKSFERHLPSFHSIAQDAERLGLEIINANPDSKIQDFEKMTVDQVL